MVLINHLYMILLTDFRRKFMSKKGRQTRRMRVQARNEAEAAAKLEQQRLQRLEWLAWFKEISESLKWPVAYNFIRDWVWGAWSQKQYGLWFEKDADPMNQLYGQWLWSTGAMLALFGAKYTYYKYRKSKLPADDKTWDMPVYNDLKIIGAASLAIPNWDLALAGGMLYLTVKTRARPMSQIAAGYWAGIATGGAEGPTQYAVPKATDSGRELVEDIADFIRDKKFRKELLSDPVHHTLNMLRKLTTKVPTLLSGLLLNGTLGGVPGFSWEEVYNRCIEGENPVNPVMTGFLIAVVVGAANYAYGMVNPLIVNKAEKLYNADEQYKKWKAQPPGGPEVSDDESDNDLEGGSPQIHPPGVPRTQAVAVQEEHRRPSMSELSASPRSHRDPAAIDALIQRGMGGGVMAAASSARTPLLPNGGESDKPRSQYGAVSNAPRTP